MKQAILAIVVIFVVWFGVGLAAKKASRAIELQEDTVVRKMQRTPSSSAVSREIGRRWDREDRLKAYIKPLSILMSSCIFVTIYSRFFARRGIRTALPYGILFGLGMGLFVLHDMCAATPMPLKIPLVWCAGVSVQGLFGGLVLAWIVKQEDPSGERKG